MRSQIADDDVNPREISEDNRKRLKTSLERFGLIGAPVYNRRTGHVVGGHQRLKALDSLMHGGDYELDVIEVDLSEKDEVRLNVALNNPDLQGTYNFAAVGELCSRFGLDPGKDCLFSPEMVAVEFPDFSDSFEGFGSVPKKEISDEEREHYRAERERMRSRQRKLDDEVGGYNMDPKGCITVVFEGESDMRKFLKDNGLDESRTVFRADEIF